MQCGTSANEHAAVKEVRTVVWTKGSPHVLVPVPSMVSSQRFKWHELENKDCAMQVAVSVGLQLCLTSGNAVDPPPPKGTLSQDGNVEAATVLDEHDVETTPLVARTKNQCRISVSLDQVALLSGADGNQQKLPLHPRGEDGSLETSPGCCGTIRASPASHGCRRKGKAACGRVHVPTAGA